MLITKSEIEEVISKINKKFKEVSVKKRYSESGKLHFLKSTTKELKNSDKVGYLSFSIFPYEIDFSLTLHECMRNSFCPPIEKEEKFFHESEVRQLLDDINYFLEITDTWEEFIYNLIFSR